MKTSKLLARVVGTLAIAGAVQLSTTNAAVACPLTKLFSKFGNASIWTAAGTAGLFGLGALYLTLPGSKENAAAADDATEDLKEHPEAPGGELDLPEVVAEDDSEKEITLV